MNYTTSSSTLPPLRLPLVASILATTTLLFFAVSFVTSADTLDLQIYLDSAERLRHGESLYAVRYVFPERATNFELQYLYPPALAALLAPLSVLPRHTIITMWQIGLVVAVTCAALMLSRLISAQTRQLGSKWLTPILVLALSFWPPTLDGILWGQVNGYVLALIVSAAFFTASGKDGAAGMSLGVAAALKATPALLLYPLIAQRKWRSVVFFALGALGAHIPLLIYPNGLQNIPAFLTTTRAISAGEVVNDPFYDYSIRRVLGMFIELPAITFSIAALLLAALYVVVVTIQSRSRCNDQSPASHAALQIICGIPIMILASPLIWFHHLIWLFPPLALIARNAATKIERRAAVVLYLALTPLLYVHVFVRHWIHSGESAVKCLPVTITAATYILAVRTITKRRVPCPREHASP